MLFGVPVQALIGLGVILLGDALLSGDVRWAAIGLFLVAAVWVSLRIMRGRGGTVLDPAPPSVPDARPADPVGDEGREGGLDHRPGPPGLAKQ